MGEHKYPADWLDRANRNPRSGFQADRSLNTRDPQLLLERSHTCLKPSDPQFNDLWLNCLLVNDCSRLFADILPRDISDRDELA